MACPYFIFKAFTFTWSNSCGPEMQEESNIMLVNFVIEKPVFIKKKGHWKMILSIISFVGLMGQGCLLTPLTKPYLFSKSLLTIDY
jgi:hypothetical protein